MKTYGKCRYSSILDHAIRWRWVMSFAPQPPYSQEDRTGQDRTGQEVGWTPEPMCTLWSRAKSAGNLTPAVQPVAHRYSGCHNSLTIKSRGSSEMVQFNVTVARNWLALIRCMNVSYAEGYERAASSLLSQCILCILEVLIIFSCGYMTGGILHREA
jgi:hypothetical protein